MISIIKYRPKKNTRIERIFNFSVIVEKISNLLPNLDQNIDHKEIGTPKTHRKFLGRYDGTYGPIPNQKLLGLLPMPFNTTKIKNLYCVGDSCFPGQGLNAVAFSGFACAHKIGSKLNINSFKLPDWERVPYRWLKSLKLFFL